MELKFLPEQSLLLDLGFMGYQPDGAKTLLPVKKSKQKKLLGQDKLYNRLLASVRVKSGTCNGGSKKNQNRER